MTNNQTQRIATAFCVTLSLFFGSFASNVSAAETPSESVDLALKQSQLADRYRQLETLLLKMAEYDSNSNPRRAALLRQALARGKERQIGPQLNDIVKLFQREQLQKAIEGQGSVKSDLKVLLDLLNSENRPDRLKNEQARVRDYIKQLDRVIRQQKSLQGRTEGGEDPDQLAKDQQRVANRTKALGDKIDEAEGLSTEGEDSGDENAEEEPEAGAADDDSQTDKSGEPGDGKGKPSDKQSGDGKAGGKPGDDSDKSESESGEESDKSNQPSEPGEKPDGEPNSKENDDPESGKSDTDKENGKKPESGESDSSESQSGESKSESGDSQQGQKGEQGQQQPGQPGQSGEQQQQAQPQEEFPGRKRIAAAEDRMRQAQEQLQQAKRDNAVEKQREAALLLQLAKAELEEILRQLREEEIERVLALLEGRFRKMLAMELKIQDQTVRLSKTPASKRNRQFTIQTGKLSLDQRKVVLEVDKALTLLREEGSSVAFPEAVEQVREDMESVAKFVAEEKVGSLTQDIETDIVEALEEMIAALQKAQQEAEERKKEEQQQQQQQQQQGDPSNQPLVNKIAELKMIRALQMRVNKRTQRFAKKLTDVEDPVGQATDDDLKTVLQALSEREQRIRRVASDIVLGKNK